MFWKRKKKVTQRTNTPDVHYVYHSLDHIIEVKNFKGKDVNYSIVNVCFNIVRKVETRWSKVESYDFNIVDDYRTIVFGEIVNSTDPPQKLMFKGEGESFNDAIIDLISNIENTFKNMLSISTPEKELMNKMNKTKEKDKK